MFTGPMRRNFWTRTSQQTPRFNLGKTPHPQLEMTPRLRIEIRWHVLDLLGPPREGENKA